MKKTLFVLTVCLVLVLAASVLSACGGTNTNTGINANNNGSQSQNGANDNQSGSDNNDNQTSTPDTNEPAAHVHAYGEWSVTTPATCTSEGVETRTCPCGESETRTIDMLEHQLGASKRIDATCTEKGFVYAECSVCHTKVPQMVIEAYGHTEIHGKCNRCGEDQNNAYVILTVDEAYIDAIAEAVMSASDNYGLCVDAITSGMSTDNKLYYFDIYCRRMFGNLTTMYNKAVFARLYWETEQYPYPRKIYTAMVDVYDKITSGAKYKNYYANKTYYNAYTLINDMGDYIDAFLTACKNLYTYRQQGMASSDYLFFKGLLSQDNVRYYTPEGADPAVLDDPVNPTIYFDSFNLDNNPTTYYVGLSQGGDETQLKTLDDTKAGIHSVKFSNCNFTEGMVLLGIYDSTGEMLGSYKLFTSTASQQIDEDENYAEALDILSAAFAASVASTNATCTATYQDDEMDYAYTCNVSGWDDERKVAVEGYRNDDGRLNSTEYYGKIDGHYYHFYEDVYPDEPEYDRKICEDLDRTEWIKAATEWNNAIEQEMFDNDDLVGLDELTEFLSVAQITIDKEDGVTTVSATQSLGSLTVTIENGLISAVSITYDDGEFNWTYDATITYGTASITLPSIEDGYSME